MNAEQKELVVVEKHDLPVASPAQNGLSIEQAFRAVIENDLNAEKLTVMKDLLAMDAERKFNAAFAMLQTDLLPVQATRPVPDKQGNIKYKYADYRDIMDQVQPLLTKHGFSVRFSSSSDDKRMTMICTLMHSGGHSVTNEFGCRIGAGPYGSTETQADSAAGTSAQRNALCDALNIVIRRGDDAREEGHQITPEQADELERRVQLTNSNREAFLKLAGAKNYADIRSERYEILDEMLRKKEQRGK